MVLQLIVYISTGYTYHVYVSYTRDLFIRNVVMTEDQLKGSHVQRK